MTVQAPSRHHKYESPGASGRRGASSHTFHRFTLPRTCYLQRVPSFQGLGWAREGGGGESPVKRARSLSLSPLHFIPLHTGGNIPRRYPMVPLIAWGSVHLSIVGTGTYVHPYQKWLGTASPKYDNLHLGRNKTGVSIILKVSPLLLSPTNSSIQRTLPWVKLVSPLC